MDDSALARSNRVLRTLGAGHRALLRAADEESLLESICNVLVEDGRYPVVWIGYVEHDAVGSIRAAAHAGLEGAFVASAHLSRDAGPPSVTAEAIRSGHAAIGRDAGTDPLLDCWRARADHGFLHFERLGCVAAGSPADARCRCALRMRRTGEAADTYRNVRRWPIERRPRCAHRCIVRSSLHPSNEG